MSRGNISKQVVTSFGCLIIVLLALTPVSMSMSNSSVPGAVHSFVSITLSPSFSQRIGLSSSLGTISPSTNTIPSLSTNSPSISTNTTPSINTSPSISTSALPSVSISPISTNAPASVSTSPSISTNGSPSVSTSLSLTGSVSLSVSAIPSISTSGSPSATTSPSISTSASSPVSTSPSILTSASPSFSTSFSLSGSILLSASTIPSVLTNASSSVSTSPSISTSMSPSLTTSPTISKSALPSVSTSPSISTSVSPSAIMSPSISTSASPSVSTRPSISTSASPSAIISPSISTSASPSAIISPSISTSASPSAIIIPSISTSASPSAIIIPSISTNASLSAIISPSISTSASPSVNANLSLSISASPSVSASPSFSTSGSPSVSKSPSISTSVSPSVGTSRSISTSVSPSVSGSPSISTSVSPSVSGSPSISTSVSPSVSTSLSFSTSVSPSLSTTPVAPPRVSLSAITSHFASTNVSQTVITSPSASAGVPPSSVSNIKSVTFSTTLMSLSSRIATPTARFIPIVIKTYLTIPENEGRVLNCTKDRFDGKHEWSRKDGEPAVTTTRILTEDTRLNITDASVEDAGEYICRNGPTVTHIFVITVEVFVKVQMIVKVLNYEYTPQLQNKSSQAYIETEKNFTAEMDKLYNDTPGYVRTEVLNFTKGSVNVDFRVIIVISATDPKNASAIPDAKAETTHQVVREAKTGFVKQLQVSPVVEVFSPPLEPRGIEIFDKKSDKLGVRWEPSEDADAFKVESYHVQYRELLTEISQNASVPSTEKKDTYSYLIKDLEPKTTYMIRVGAENRHGINFNEETASKTLDPPFAEWIIVLIVLGILLVIGIIVGLIVFKRRRAEQRRKKLKEEEDGRFGGLIGDVRLASVPNYETKNVKGMKFSFANKSFMPSEANWEEISYEKITLMNELGSGAFGVVYKGELKQDNGNVTPCAVKTLKESATTEEIRDLYNELEIMTNVGYHPNLVNLLGACTQDGHLLVVIEIAENGNLLEFLRKSRETNENYGNIQGTVLTNDMRLRIATDVAKGMAHLANGRWIHRDLAARNVLLAKNYVAKVADYGMARDIYEQLMYKKETQGKLPVKWMAIESLETYIFTTESDVWSYGVLLWEMESGGLKPYAGLSATEQIDQLKKGYRLEKPDGCSDAVYQIMRDCWNPNPKARPTFDDLVTRLENMADSS